mmetsp:Transcript_107457/g.291301  ORF Transcript_107457/g.291301 Transcript_107457/m.291301 type:complete len:262 (+) Transcript_107457:638-1423(+)
MLWRGRRAVRHQGPGHTDCESARVRHQEARQGFHEPEPRRLDLVLLRVDGCLRGSGRRSAAAGLFGRRPAVPAVHRSPLRALQRRPGPGDASSLRCHFRHGRRDAGRQLLRMLEQDPPAGGHHGAGQGIHSEGPRGGPERVRAVSQHAGAGDSRPGRRVEQAPLHSSQGLHREREHVARNGPPARDGDRALGRPRRVGRHGRDRVDDVGGAVMQEQVPAPLGERALPALEQAPGGWPRNPGGARSRGGQEREAGHVEAVAD